MANVEVAGAAGTEAGAVEAAPAVMPIITPEGPVWEEVVPHILRVKLPVPQAVPQTNAYIIEGEQETFIIDCGCNVSETRETFNRVFEERGLDWRTTSILLTHTDFDHCAGIRQIWRPGMKIYSIASNYALRQCPVMGDEVFRGLARQVSEEHGVPFEYDHDYWAPMRDKGDDGYIMRRVKNGTMLPIAGYLFRIIATPGHSIDHICLWDEHRGVLISGDFIMQSYPSVVLSSDRDELGELLASLDLLEGFEPRIILPSHGEPFVGLEERVRKTRDHFERQMQSVLKVYEAGARTVPEIAYQVTKLPRRRPWEERSLFTRIALVGQTMALVRHMVEVGMLPDEFEILHK